MNALVKHSVARRISEKEGVSPIMAEAMAEVLVKKSLNTESGKAKVDKLQKMFDKMVEDSKKNK